MRKLAAILIIMCIGAVFGLGTASPTKADAAASGSAWRTWLSSEQRMLPLAAAIVKVAGDSGLDGLASIIASDIKDLKQNKVPREKVDIYLASIWIASINAAMLQRVDPFPNPAYQEIIDEGMNFAGPRLNIPDVEACMLLTAQTIIKAQKEEQQ